MRACQWSPRHVGWGRSLLLEPGTCPRRSGALSGWGPWTAGSCCRRARAARCPVMSWARPGTHRRRERLHRGTSTRWLLLLRWHPPACEVLLSPALLLGVPHAAAARSPTTWSHATGAGTPSKPGFPKGGVRWLLLGSGAVHHPWARTGARCRHREA